ncbi:DUF5658 family protein [Rosistilla oblonga]|uniref:DUF5658 family protein n=1 Tax=Rosistilla oblonga TaxID=2527990 RepID=UPI003A96E835
MDAIKQACRVLGVDEAASAAQIEAVYREKESRYQADPGSDPWDFQQVQQAYQILRRRAAAATVPAPSAAAKSQPQAFRDSPAKDARRSPGSAAPRSFQELPPAAASPEMPKHLLWQTFFRELPLQSETSYFLLANLLDVFMTYGLLKFGGIETNPIANYFLQRWGFDGMIALKMGSVAFVVILVQQIAVRDLTKARRLLIAGTAIVFAVVVYSGVLLSRVIR